MTNDSKDESVTPHNLVTEEHVKAALKADKGNDAHLKSWSMEDFTKPGDNYACVVSSVKVNYSLNQQSQQVVYISKLNPCRNFESFDAFFCALFEKECKFYLELLPELNLALKEVGVKSLRLPRCFHGCLEKKKEILFLEDLRPKGFKMFDRRKGLDVPHATLILQELARLHAASRLFMDKTPNNDIVETYDFLLKDMTSNEESKDMTSTMVFIEAQMNSTIAMLKKIGGYERAITWIENLLPRAQEELDKHLSSSKYNVVCHGDCWNNNVLFRYNDDGDPVEVMLLDLQLCRRSSPANDLNYLLYTSLTGQVRKPHLDSLLNTYHSAFSDVMETAGKDIIFTRDQLKQEFRDKNVIGAIFAMMIVPLIITEPENVPDLSEGTDDDIDDLMNSMKEKALDALETNPIFRPRFLALFDEFIDSGLIP